MSWVDVMIVLLLLTALVRGTQVGLLQLVFSSGGFVSGLLLGSLVAKRIAVHFSSPLGKLLLVVSIEIFCAFLLGTFGDIIANKLQEHAIRLRLGKLNKFFGAVLAVFFNLVVIWLLASAVGTVKSYNLGRDVQHSYIVHQLDALFPNPPDALATLEKIISPNGFPNVFLGLEPQHTTVSPHNKVNNQAVLADEKSVVKIQGEGCGGLVFGSGFVAAPNLVVTNAHVIAGISGPQVVDSKKTYKTKVVWFDANLDLAILRVNNLPDPPLTITSRTLPDSDATAILGYPGGGPLVADDTAIIDHVTAEGRNIYNQGIVLRNIYEVQGDVEPGNSGGPLLAADGTVAGVVFARSVSQNSVGYALLANQITDAVSQAQQHSDSVSTGQCTQD